MDSAHGVKPSPAHDLAEWVDEHSDYLLSYATARLGTRERAEDFVQETFLVAHEKLGTYRGEAPPRAWLLTILRNKICDEFRRGSKEVPLSATFAEDGDLDRYFNDFGAWRSWFFRHWRGSPEEVADSKNFLVVLNGCLDKLPLRMRQIVVGRSLDGLDHTAACEHFGITPGNLDVMMYRARMHLRGCLEEHWFKPHRHGGRS
jgi:RNA polymerase sigma-70 factor (ECF subfamily)